MMNGEMGVDGEINGAAINYPAVNQRQLFTSKNNIENYCK
jgi:hypothetical protein